MSVTLPFCGPARDRGFRTLKQPSTSRKDQIPDENENRDHEIRPPGAAAVSWSGGPSTPQREFKEVAQCDMSYLVRHLPPSGSCERVPKRRAVHYRSASDLVHRAARGGMSGDLLRHFLEVPRRSEIGRGVF